MSTPIEIGDVFVKTIDSKHATRRDMVHIIITAPSGTRSSAKTWYMRLTGTSSDSMWIRFREEMETRPFRRSNHWRYVGTLSPQWLSYIQRNWTAK